MMRALVIGLDAFDPTLFERLCGNGQMPNLARYVQNGGYAHLAVADPPQTEVSWASIATGLDPGGHGIFDFVHRDPATYAPFLSLLRVKNGVLGTQFVPAHKSRTFFEEATRLGFPATSLWWPATFPARPELPVRTLPGLGTPDLLGRWGVGAFFSADVLSGNPGDGKIPRLPLTRAGRGRYAGALPGPIRQGRHGPQASSAPFSLEPTGARSARLRVDGGAVTLCLGRWSPILEISFDLGPFLHLKAITRVLLSQAEPEPTLYALPVQIHPLHSPWHYGSPAGFVKHAWQHQGPFLTMGWPQDTTALEEGYINDAQFLDLCDAIDQARERIAMAQLQQFREGVVGIVFDSLDRIQHMFWASQPEIVYAWYERLDALVGRLEGCLPDAEEPCRILILSDHGIADYRRKAHLNRWLQEHGYLQAQQPGQPGSLQSTNWAQTKAYAVGLNSLYLNLRGREGQGAVAPEQGEALRSQLCADLMAWRSPDGQNVVARVARREDLFTGPFAHLGPDLVVGYAPGYRASPETALGQWGETTLEANHDHWEADHCLYADAVPGVLFCNSGIAPDVSPSFRDIPAMVLGQPLAPGGPSSGNGFDVEDEEVARERLKGLGYL
ncbi:MAG: hypothetical protein GX605_08085 [Chloroflexi bacterium]|nr:hypothetical protein [Chloroflexota bacterium]